MSVAVSAVSRGVSKHDRRISLRQLTVVPNSCQKTWKIRKIQRTRTIRSHLHLVINKQGTTNAFPVAVEDRHYDPTIGRWTTKDPIGFAGGDTNLYSYVSQNPMSYIDPNGMCPTCIFGAVVGGVIGGIANGVAASSAGASGKQIAVSVLIGAGTGALAGGIAGATGFVGGVGLAGAGAALNNAGNQAYFNGTQNIDWNDVGISAILGAGLGGIAGGAFGSAGYAFGLSAGAASGVAAVTGAVSGSTANNGIPGNMCPSKK